MAPLREIRGASCDGVDVVKSIAVARSSLRVSSEQERLLFFTAQVFTLTPGNSAATIAMTRSEVQEHSTKLSLTIVNGSMLVVFPSLPGLLSSCCTGGRNLKKMFERT